MRAGQEWTDTEGFGRVWHGITHDPVVKPFGHSPAARLAMSWVDAVRTWLASAPLPDGLLQPGISRRQKSQYAHLLFFALTASTSACAALELLMMRAVTVEDYATALRWANVPLSVAILSLVGFVHCYFGAGRTWLATAVCAIRMLALALNFTTGVNLNFANVTALEHVVLPGGVAFSVPVGAPNPWWMVVQIDNLLLVTFLADAAATLWHRGGAIDRRRALLVGGGLILCLVYGLTLSLWKIPGPLQLPVVVTLALLPIALAMGYELGADPLRGAQLARELRESEERLELAARAARLALWSWDMANDVLWMNPTGRALFELPQGRRPGLATFLRQIDLEDRERLRNAICETAHNGGSFELEFRLSAPGSTRWIATRGELERRASSDGLLRGVSIDISDRRRVERELSEQRNELTHLSRVASLGEMAGSLAHEINQPLMAILSNAQAAQRFMACDNADLAEVKAAIADIVEADRRAGEVIHRLRALLRKGEVQRGPLDLNNIVADVLRLMRSELMNRGVAVSAELVPNLPSLLGDRIQLQQVLLNLVMNACDAMEGVGGRHQLIVRTRVAEGAGIEVSVSDSGRGIPAADLERIFEPFVTTKEHGMGMGLSVSRTIVAAHRGRLWAESVDGQGATMRVALPVTGASQ